jgi:phosphoglucomutase
MSNLEESFGQAADRGDLLPASAENLREFLATCSRESDRASVAELVEGGHWRELDDRFFKKLAFGTSGLRGRTIGKVVTNAEAGTGTPRSDGRPEFPCVGTNAMNFYNLSRATQGLARFVLRWASEHGHHGRPAIVFAHDTRHFSQEFAAFCAGIATDLGCDAYLFDGHRPTPELSFAVRSLRAQAGVMVTASHNPAHDNGYKVYFGDGASIIDPVAGAITDEVNSVAGDRYLPAPPGERGTVTTLGREIDEDYLARLEETLLQPGLLAEAKGLKIVFTPIHGTGGVHVPAVLRRLGFTFTTVPEQDVPDGRFPTVPSPNPENATALRMGLDLAEATGSDLVLATDPDCDRLGVAARGRDGRMVLLTGNQIGSLMAWYRTKTLFELGVLGESNRGRATIIKTLVTTPLQAAVAEAFGVRIVETLTGFKYIGAKLGKYEALLPDEARSRYREMGVKEARDAHLRGGRFFIFGGEESYGYLGADFVRDKDGNGAVVMFAELAAYASSRGLTVVELVDEVYRTYGYFEERQKSVAFEGAAGAAQMAALVESYKANPPREVAGTPVTRVRDFSTGRFTDSDGDPVPPENMLIIDLADGSSLACRPSGTEPMMKFYLFGNRRPAPGQEFSDAQLEAARREVAAALDAFEAWIDADRGARLAG